MTRVVHTIGQQHQPPEAWVLFPQAGLHDLLLACIHTAWHATVIDDGTAVWVSPAGLHVLELRFDIDHGYRLVAATLDGDPVNIARAARLLRSPDFA